MMTAKRSLVVKKPANSKWVAHNSKTGRFTELQASKGKKLPRKGSEEAVSEASSRRSAALKRLADR